MSRPYLYSVVLIAAVVAVFVVGHFSSERAQRVRESGYKKVLLSYSQVLKTGMTRKQVEDYLSLKDIKFRQLCCVSPKEFSKGVYDNSYDDLVKIGQEDVPWVCSENNVYIALEFLGSEQSSVPRAEASDKLKDLSVYHKLDGCL